MQQNNTPDWPLVSIVSVNWNQNKITQLMLATLREVSYPNVEVILVDNGSEDFDEAGMLAAYPGLKVVRTGENLGFAGGNNVGFQHAQGTYVLLLNNDTLVPKHFLQPMVGSMEADAGIGVVSPKIYFVDHAPTLQYAGTTEINPITMRGQKFGFRQHDLGQFNESGTTGLANGACMLVRKHLIDQVGGLPEIYFLYYEEHDFTVQLKKLGYQVFFQADSFIWHLGSATSGQGSPLKTYYYHRNRLLYLRRHATRTEYRWALAYLSLIAYPKTLVQYLIGGRWKHLKAFTEALKWNLKQTHLWPANPHYSATN